MDIAKRKKVVQINGKQLKELLKKIQRRTRSNRKRDRNQPQIDQTTQMYMQKILNVWIAQGKEIDEEKFWKEVDYYIQFTHPIEYYEK